MKNEVNRTHVVKKIEQFVRTRWQAFRAWQENPKAYQMDETEHVCNNCGHTFKGNYHCLEIPLYYRSLKNNIEQRCKRL